MHGPQNSSFSYGERYSTSTVKEERYPIPQLDQWIHQCDNVSQNLKKRNLAKELLCEAEELINNSAMLVNGS